MSPNRWRVGTGSAALAFVAAIALGCGGSKSAARTATPTPAAATTVDAGAEPITPEQKAISHDHAKKIADAAGRWTALHTEGACPAVADLKADGTLSALAQDRDAWGRPFLILCGESEAEVRSDGPDGHGQTPDDIVEKGPLTAPAAVSGPPARGDVAATVDAGAFSALSGTEQIGARVAACEAKANEDPSTRGKVALHVVVRGDGTVKSAVVVRTKNASRSPRVLACVLREVARMQFGPSPSRDDVSFDY